MEYVERASAKKYVYMKQRIAKAQRNARAVGLLYLFATLVISVLTCFALVACFDIDHRVEKLSALHFWKAFKEIESFRYKSDAILTAGLYGATLFVLLCNILRGLSKLNWLFKRKASRVYGFNRNAYAMDDLASVFSSSFTCILVNHFLILLLNNYYELQTSFWVCVGVGLAVHFIGGVWSGNVSLFDIQSGIIEDERQVGSFSPVLRNLLQIAFTGLAAYCFTKQSIFREYVWGFAYDWRGELARLKDVDALLYFASEIAIVTLLIGMTIYAFSNKEYDMDGRETPGRKTFLLLSFLATGVMIFYYVYFGEDACFRTGSIAAQLQNIVWLLVFVATAFLADLCLIAFPRRKKKYQRDEIEDDRYLYKLYGTTDVYVNKR